MVASTSVSAQALVDRGALAAWGRARGWRYLWSTTPVHRWEMSGSWRADAPPELPAGTDLDELQRFNEGVGPADAPDLSHADRRLDVDARAADGPDGGEPRRRRPLGVRDLPEGRGREGRLSTAATATWSECPGPGTARSESSPSDATSFRLATLPGHLEAGQIEFRASARTTARSGSKSSPGPAAATGSATSSTPAFGSPRRSSCTCGPRSCAGSSIWPRGRMEGGIVITTRVVPRPTRCPARDGRAIGPTRAGSRARGPGRPPAQLRRDEIGDHAVEAGWHLDDMVEAAAPRGLRAPRPRKAAGRSPGGSWTATSLPTPGSSPPPMTKIAPLAGRDMLLRISFKGCACGSG